jgi:HK97 family phage major capsid protein
MEKVFEFMSSFNLRNEKTNLIQELDKIHSRSNDQVLSKEDQYKWDSTLNQVNEIEYHLRNAIIKEAQTQQANLILDQRNADQFRNKNGSGSKGKNYLGKIMRAAKGKGNEESRSLIANGSALVPTDMIRETIFDLQSQNDLFTGAGAKMVQIDQNAQWPRISGLPVAYFQPSELQSINDSAPTITSVKADLKDLAVRVIVSNQLILDSADDVEVVLQNAMIQAINQSILESVFSGSGASGQPTGLDNLSNVLTVDMAGEKLTNYRFIIQAVKQLLDANMPIQNISMFGSPDSWQQLESLTNGFGDPLREPNTIAQMRKYFTSAIKTDYGSGQDRTKLYLGDFTRLVMGYQNAITLTSDNSADKLGVEFILWMRYDLLHLSPDSFLRIDNIETGLPEYGI